MSDMYVCMYACMYQEFLKKAQQIPRVFAHTWRIKLILILTQMKVNLWGWKHSLFKVSFYCEYVECLILIGLTDIQRCRIVYSCMTVKYF